MTRGRVIPIFFLILLTTGRATAFAPASSHLLPPIRHQFSRLEYTILKPSTLISLINEKQSQSKERTSSASSLSATPAAVAAITGAISGGLFAGGLHAVAGKRFDCFLVITHFNLRQMY